jgi:hypothetical protein
MKRVRVKDIRAVASRKQTGYLAAIRAAGVPSKDGQWLTFTDADHAAIAIKYATPASPACTRPAPGKLPSLAGSVDRKPTAGCSPCLAKAIAAAQKAAHKQP